MKLRIVILILTVASLASAGVAAEKILKPSRGEGLLERAYFGDSESVSRLAVLLDDDDPLVREKAVLDLGETHNREALPHILRAIKDPEPTVRAAAVKAAAESGFDEMNTHIISALGDGDSGVVLAAISTVRALKLADAKDTLLKTSVTKNRTVQHLAIKTLTELGLALSGDEINNLLQSGWLGVRLAALENALLLDSLADTTAIAVAADSGEPAQQAAAMAVLGKFNYSAAETYIGKVENSSNPILRRGAVWAYQYAGKADCIRKFLDDESPLVRLAAIKAAGITKADDCNDRLFELMTSAPHKLSHDACLASLLAIAKPETAKLAAKWLKENADNMVAVDQWVAQQNKKMEAPVSEIIAKKEALAVLQRNASSCCRLLASLKSTLAADQLRAMLAGVQMDSPVLVALAEYYSTVTGEADTKAMANLLDRLKARCGEYLAAIMAMQPPPPYSREVTVAVIKTLGKLKSPDIERSLIGIMAFQFGATRQEAECAAAIRAVRPILSPENSKAVEGILADIVNNSLLLTLQYEAAISLGEMKSTDSLDALRTLLNKKRPNKTVMQAAAWAIQEISGETPAVPDPVRHEGNWIIRAAKR